MKKKTVIVVVCAAIAAAVGMWRVSAADDIKAQIDAANGRFEAAFARGDSAGVAACYTKDGQILPPNAPPLTGTEAIAGFWAQAMQAGLGNVDLITVEVEQHGDTAIEVGRAEIRAKDGALIDQSKYVVIWKHVDGAWKLHRDIWNSNAPAQ